jgi:CRP/FNR family transcriptional regulator
MVIPLELLKSIPYFSGLRPDELEAIRSGVFEKTAERGEVILLEGEPAQALFFVASGAVKVFKTSPEGKEQILNIVRPGESFNDVALFDDGPNLASAQAMVPVVLYGVKKVELKAILERHPQVALNIIRVLAQRVRQSVGLVEDLSFRHVLSRVAKILLEHASDGTGPRPRLTQQEIAAMAGTAREVVGRSLKALEEEGLIRVERHRIVIANRPALEQLVTESS